MDTDTGLQGYLDTDTGLQGYVDTDTGLQGYVDTDTELQDTWIQGHRDTTPIAVFVNFNISLRTLTG